MIYTIYELIQPDLFTQTIPDGYYSKTVYKDILQKVDLNNFESEHSNIDSAISEIQKNTERLKHMTLTVIPIFTINWAGEINQL